MSRAHRRRRALRESARLTAGLRAACATGDAAVIGCMLGPDARLVLDSGGALALSGETFGAEAARALQTALHPFDDLDLQHRSVNGSPGLLARRSGVVIAVIVPTGRPGAAATVWVVANPDKLRDWR